MAIQVKRKQTNILNMTEVFHPYSQNLTEQLSTGNTIYKHKLLGIKHLFCQKFKYK